MDLMVGCKNRNRDTVSCLTLVALRSWHFAKIRPSPFSNSLDLTSVSLIVGLTLGNPSWPSRFNDCLSTSMESLKTLLINGERQIPHIIYGTAFKPNHVDELVTRAIEVGYRAFDSAPHPVTYREAHVGKGLREGLKYLSGGKEALGNLFIQTKLTTHEAYRDAPKPYSSDDSPAEQVTKSLNQSLHNLKCDGIRLSAYILHAPFPTIEETMQYWAAMEMHVPDKVDYLGISNVSLEILQEVYSRSRIKPSIVQNNFSPAFGYDRDIISWCAENRIVYQAYSVLKSNVDLLSCKLVGWLAEKHDITEPQALYLLLLSYGDGIICILNGTSSPESIESDLRAVMGIGKLEGYIVDGFCNELEKLSQPLALPDGPSCI